MARKLNLRIERKPPKAVEVSREVVQAIVTPKFGYQPKHVEDLTNKEALLVIGSLLQTGDIYVDDFQYTWNEVGADITVTLQTHYGSTPYLEVFNDAFVGSSYAHLSMRVQVGNFSLKQDQKESRDRFGDIKYVAYYGASYTIKLKCLNFGRCTHESLKEQLIEFCTHAIRV